MNRVPTARAAALAVLAVARATPPALRRGQGDLRSGFFGGSREREHDER